MADNFLIHHEASKLSTEAVIRNVVVGSVILLMDFQMKGKLFDVNLKARFQIKKNDFV